MTEPRRKTPETNVLGDAIRLIRVQRRLTLRQLAKAVGVSAAYLCMLEGGVRSPTPLLRDRIATALSVNRSELELIPAKLARLFDAVSGPELNEQTDEVGAFSIGP